ncbi:JAB domain-containing protein, partial [Butyricimonas virosa]
KADDELTKNITQLSSLASVDFIDHLIVSTDDYYSYSNECRYDVLKPQSMMNNLSPFLEKEEIILPNPL